MGRGSGPGALWGARAHPHGTYHIGVWPPPILLRQHCAQQLQQLQPIQASVPVVVVQHKEVEQGCGARSAVGLGPRPCHRWSPRLPTALPCSRVMASTSCSGGPRLLTALRSSLGMVGLGVGMNPPCPTACSRAALPYSCPQDHPAPQQAGHCPCPTPTHHLPPCAAPGPGVHSPVVWGSLRGKDSRQRGQLRAQWVSRGQWGLRPGQERERLPVPLVGVQRGGAACPRLA